MNLQLRQDKRERRYNRAVEQGFDLSPAEAARYLDVSVRWLELRRHDSTGPVYRKQNNGQIRYTRAALDAYMPGGAAQNLPRTAAARYLNRSVSFLEKAAAAGIGPIYKTFHPGLKRYPLSELTTYLASLT